METVTDMHAHTHKDTQTHTHTHTHILSCDPFCILKFLYFEITVVLFNEQRNTRCLIINFIPVPVV